MAGKDIELILKNKRLSFVDLFAPKVYRNKKTQEIESYSYEINALLDKDEDKEDIERVRAAMKQAIANEWPSDAPTIPADNRCLRAGEIVDPDTGEKKARWDGYENKNYLSAKRKVDSPESVNPVQLLDGVKGADGKFIRLKASDGKLYSGCYADIIVRIYAYNGTKGGNPHRVNCSLEAVKFRRHGEAFGAKAVDADSMFEENDEEDGFDAPATKSTARDDDDDLL